MKHIISIILLLSTLSLSAQQAISTNVIDEGNKLAKLKPGPIIDTSKVEIIYLHKAYDPTLKARRNIHYILQIGNNLSKYVDYGEFRVDSVAKAANYHMTVNEYVRISKRYSSRQKELSFIYLIKQYNSSNNRHYCNIFIDFYAYTEPFTEFNWVLNEDEEKEVCGYKCHSATVSAWGRNWTAWYTEDIPINDGPYKFRGLPGMILEVCDDENEHLFSAKIIRNGGHSIGTRSSHFIPTTREKFNKALADFMENGMDAIDASGLVYGTSSPNPSSKKRRMFFNPIEKE